MTKRKRTIHVLGYGYVIPALDLSDKTLDQRPAGICMWKLPGGDVLVLAAESIREVTFVGDVIPIDVADLWPRRGWEKVLAEVWYSWSRMATGRPVPAAWRLACVED